MSGILPSQRIRKYELTLTHNGCQQKEINTTHWQRILKGTGDPEITQLARRKQQEKGGKFEHQLVLSYCACLGRRDTGERAFCASVPEHGAVWDLTQALAFQF